MKMKVKVTGLSLVKKALYNFEDYVDSKFFKIKNLTELSFLFSSYFKSLEDEIISKVELSEADYNFDYSSLLRPRPDSPEYIDLRLWFKIPPPSKTTAKSSTFCIAFSIYEDAVTVSELDFPFGMDLAKKDFEFESVSSYRPSINQVMIYIGGRFKFICSKIDSYE